MRLNTTVAANVLGWSVLLAAPAWAQAVRHYDCSKAGNANKAVCKNAVAASPPAPATPAAAPVKAARHYDCTKAGNANKTVCKNAAPVSAPADQAPAASAAAPKPSIFSRLHSRASAPVAPAAGQPVAPAATAAAPSYKGKSITTSPAGATGQCKDGTYTHATHHSGACSSHGGVASWTNG